MTSTKAHVLIAGGGIGGVAAALALLRRGFDVSVYEQAPELGEVGAGIQISPNGNRALNDLGVFESLRALSTRAARKDVRLWNTGRAYPAFEFGAEAVRRYGYPYLTVYRPDLLAVLVEAVRALKPDAIVLNARASGYEKGADGRVALLLADGRRIEGDLLIGADGVHSRIRGQMAGDMPAQFTGMVAWRAVIPTERLPERFHDPIANAWVGPQGHVLQYPLRKGKLVNFVGTVEREEWAEEGWNVTGSRAECLRDFEGWHEDIQTLIDAAPTLSKWALVARSIVPNWTDGPVALLGDACHPTLPLMAQGAVMAIEDAVVLGRCLEAIGPRPEALSRYGELRIPVCRAKVEAALENLSRFHNEAYTTEETAGPFIEMSWGRAAIEDRYDWIYRDDVTSVGIEAPGEGVLQP